MLTITPKRRRLSTLPRRPVPDLPHDVIAEILKRLQVKPLLRFKCVSKTWHALISSPLFAKSHLNFQRKDQNKLMTFDTENDKTHFSLFSIVHNKKSSTTSVNYDRSLEVPEGALRVLGSHNGLLCFRGKEHKIIVWNPCTGKMKEIKDACGFQYVSIYGFGYDEQNSDYRVVYACVQNNRKNKLSIYSFKSGAWENIQEGFSSGIVFPPIGVHVNGTLNWCNNNLKAHDNWKWNIISLNLTTNAATMLSLPSYERGSAIHMSESRGFLWASCLHKGQMSVWQMNEFGVEASWTKLVSVPNLPKPPRPNGMMNNNAIVTISKCVFVLYVSENVNVLMKVERYLRLYRSKTKRSKRFEVPMPGNRGFKAISYLETLVSPCIADDEDGDQRQ